MFQITEKRLGRRSNNGYEGERMEEGEREKEKRGRGGVKRRGGCERGKNISYLLVCKL